jgi:hypothetical protein
MGFEKHRESFKINFLSRQLGWHFDFVVVL